MSLFLKTKKTMMRMMMMMTRMMMTSRVSSLRMLFAVVSMFPLFSSLLSLCIHFFFLLLTWSALVSCTCTHLLLNSHFLGHSLVFFEIKNQIILDGVHVTISFNILIEIYILIVVPCACSCSVKWLGGSSAVTSINLVIAPRLMINNVNGHWLKLHILFP